MDLPRLIDALSRPEAYPEPVAAVEVRHTHISVVFLAGTHAYKVRKPVALGFLDFSTLAKRRKDCDEEVRLNRRLAPSVYQGVVPITEDGGGVRLGGTGEVVEWAVQMERLPEEATLERWLQRGDVPDGLVATLARRVAGFHARAERDARIARFGRFEVVAANARENFTQAAPQVGTTLSGAVRDRLAARTEAALARLRPVIESRAARGIPCDTHGDLHLDHVYVFPDRPPPADLLIIDCIEFNERFRFADPIADLAFLVMDLAFHGRRDLARLLTQVYFETADDAEGQALVPFYTAYRAAVRGKVEGFELTEQEIPEAERSAALTRARAHWLLALHELEEPGRRPCLVLLGGLPGTGKSTLGRGLAERAGFRVLRTDVLRKELAGLAAHATTPAPFRQGIYTPAWTERTYTECLRRAEALLFEGERVLIDASFAVDSWRQVFLQAAQRLGVPGLLLLCQAAPETVRQRLQARHGDASDADWAVYQQAAAHWEAPGASTRPALHELAAEGSPDAVLAAALQVLQAAHLA